MDQLSDFCSDLSKLVTLISCCDLCPEVVEEMQHVLVDWAQVTMRLEVTHWVKVIEVA